MRVICLIILLCLGSSQQASTPDSLTYEAGVVEFNYVRGTGISEVDLLADNLRKYLEIMTSAPSNLDIIVFPEMTLNNIETAVEISEPEYKISPCDSLLFPVNNLVKQISCAAKAHQRYVVVNMVTYAPCPDTEMLVNKDPRTCSEKIGTIDVSYYNTNVVFDRNGTIISRYRKFNLFGEDVSKPFKPMMASFDTDFGVKFGHFICFDLMFRYPALELVRAGITDIVFPTMWFSELPFLTAVQAQQHWAYSNNVNFLAAGANNPARGSTGTGIFAGRKGSLISVMEGSNESNLYTATVPKRGLGDGIAITQNAVRYTKQQMAPLTLKRDQLDKYSIRFLPDHKLTPDASLSSTHCHGEFCCDFKYSYTSKETDQPRYHFALAVYHGNRTFDGFADGGVVACAVLACQTEDVSTCGVRNETLEFVQEWYRLEITGSFPHDNNFVYMPTTLDPSIIPFGVDEYNFEQKMIDNEADSTHKYQISMTSLGNRMRDEFYAFGIYGRDFNLDEADGAASSLKIYYALVLCFTSIVFIRNLM